MDQTAADGSRKRNQTACEACRISKLRCVPSDKHGICQKYVGLPPIAAAAHTEPMHQMPELQTRMRLETRPSHTAATTIKAVRLQSSLIHSLNETESNTNFTHASSSTTPNSNEEPPSPPPKPSGTFSIDFAVPGRQAVDENFETLRTSHMAFIDNLFPDCSETPAASPAVPPPKLPPPASASPAASSSTNSHSIQDLHAKPTFNLVSAQSLLDTFRSMLVYCPCIVLPPDATVSQLSATRPFVLLAILAAASGSRTLQGHNLYDEEFRKVLALKVVAGGEQSIELLQGILVYCIWYVAKT